MRKIPRLIVLSIPFLLSYCGNSAPAPKETATHDPPAVVDTTPPAFVSQPNLQMAPNPDTPLAGVLNFSTDEPTQVVVTVNDGSRAWDLSFPDLSTSHSLTLLGFHPGKTHTVHVTIFDAAGNASVAAQDLVVTTDPVPATFPKMVTLVSQPDKMEPGVTLFSTAGWGANSLKGAIIAVDETGEVVWYQNRDGVGDLQRISNGNLLFIDYQNKIIEIDMLGNVLNQWQTSLNQTVDSDSIPVETQAFHHEVTEMPNGNFLVLSVELRSIDNFPTSETDPNAPTETASVAGDVVVEFTPDGTIVHQWHLLDLLDPLRIGYGSLLGFWNGSFPSAPNGTRDWTHGNAVVYDSNDDSVIVSSRHQDAIVKFSHATGQLVWILGNHDNLPTAFDSFLLDPVLSGEFDWQYHQHAVDVMPNGDLILFDNGNYRASPFDAQVSAANNYSRAVQFTVDPQNRTVTQRWEYGKHADEILYGSFVGDANYLPKTGNILVDFGGLQYDAGGNPVESGKKQARIIEVTHQTPAEKVFDLKVYDDSADVNNGWHVYRAERLPSLYPSAP